MAVVIYRSDDDAQPESWMYKCGAKDPEAYKLIGYPKCTQCKALLPEPHVHIYSGDMSMGAACSEACAIQIANGLQ